VNNWPTVTLLYGGIGGEREVSLKSAENAVEQLSHFFRVIPVCLDENAVPPSVLRESEMIFPLVHGDFGEDGTLQAILEERWCPFVGSGSESSRLCIDKVRTKVVARKHGVGTLPHLTFVNRSDLWERRTQITLNSVLKPTDKGSSLDVHPIRTRGELEACLECVGEGMWMVEPLVEGRQMTVGILMGQALGVVEIVPRKGFLDYHNKYTPNVSECICPAPIDPVVQAELIRASEIVFAAAHCLDFARVDFILDGNNRVWFLEINTLPGLTKQSYFPKSAAGLGYPLDAVLRDVVLSAVERYAVGSA
jgi:D-alanine-D-alanine ligase